MDRDEVRDDRLDEMPVVGLEGVTHRAETLPGLLDEDVEGAPLADDSRLLPQLVEHVVRTGAVGGDLCLERLDPVEAPLVAQQFIYTGRWPVNYRVVTLFGTRLLAWRCEADHRYWPLESRWDFRATGGITVVSNKKDSHYTLAFDADVIALAERAHAAFPDQPLLGTDIVRDAETGALYVIECNPRGDAWLISSDTGREIEQANGLDFAAQFDALEVATEVLIRETRARAC